LIEELLAAKPVVTDGAWGTELQARGLAPGDLPDAWNLLHPDRVQEVARAYVEAGSAIILTNTFRSNRIALAGHGLADQVVGLNRRGVEISRSAAAGRSRVFASMGPSGRMLISGDVTEDELRIAFSEQARVLADAGAEAIVVETMADLPEAVLAVAAARTTGLPVVACMVFDTGKNRDRTVMGITPEQAAEKLAGAGADVIGANCGLGIESYVSICRRLHAVAGRPIWIKPNAGLPDLEEGRPVYRTTAEEFASSLPALVSAGAAFVGGCCGTTPAFVSALVRARELLPLPSQGP